MKDAYILVNLISHSVKQLCQGSRTLVESMERLSFEDIAMREIAEAKISYELAGESPESEPVPASYSSQFQFSPIMNPKRSMPFS
ncbi:DNA-directed RNA polymerase subunit omega [Puniceicoccaceae bacterium K14]|nr:DNA-directed RNA polymerase subunit omega [Puniceicoccaceae bacterium K14]